MTRLEDMDVLLIDIQASGASPKHGHPIELAWRQHQAGAEGETVSRLIALPDEEEIPRRVSRLTGITHEMLIEHGVPAEEAWDDYQEALGTRRLVAHFARYERAFLQDMRSRFAPDSPEQPIVCTHAIARRLFPDLPRRGLRPLAGYLGKPLPDDKRAGAHVDATAFIWDQLVARLAKMSILTLEQLQSWLELPAPKRVKRSFPLPRKRRLSLPEVPGVYRMLANGGKVLYVGKATSLKDRVNSYFRSRRGSTRHTFELLSQVWDLECTPTATPLEAALLEQDEIKRLDPHYNIALKAGDRRIVFVSPDFRIAEQPSEEHRLGPVPHAALWGVCRTVHSLLARESWEEADAIALRTAMAIPERWRGAIPFELMAEAITEFRSDHGLTSDDTSETLLALGRSLWLERLKARAERAEEDAPDDDVEGELNGDVPGGAEDDESETGDQLEDALDDGGSRPWTTDALRAVFADSVSRAAALLERSGWLCDLCDATVVWEESAGKKRRIHLRGGRLCGADNQGDPVTPRGYRRQRANRQALFDLTTYDRLRVLTTELRRVMTDGRSVFVTLSPDQMLEAEGLAERLARFQGELPTAAAT